MYNNKNLNTMPQTMKLSEIAKYMVELLEKGFRDDSDEFSKAWNEFYQRVSEAGSDEVKEAMRYVEGHFGEVVQNVDSYTDLLEMRQASITSEVKGTLRLIDTMS